jgi:outer membrane protein OmpA-like peptidoglycan-associated protein
VNSYAPIDASSTASEVDAVAIRGLRSRREAGGERMRILSLCALTLVFAACTTTQPKPEPVVVHHPVARPAAPRPAKPVPTPAAGIAVVELANYEAERARIKSVLARESRDSLAPSEVGYYMDVLQGRLKQVAGKNTGVVRTGDRIELALAEPFAFAAGNGDQNPEVRGLIVSTGKVLVEYDKILVTVRVQPDAANPPLLGSKLAEQRALALAHDLSEAGVAENRIIATCLAADSHSHIEVNIEPIVRTTASGH